MIISPLLQINTDNRWLTVDYICVEHNGECIEVHQHVEMVMLEGLFSSKDVCLRTTWWPAPSFTIQCGASLHGV